MKTIIDLNTKIIEEELMIEVESPQDLSLYQLAFSVKNKEYIKRDFSIPIFLVYWNDTNEFIFTNEEVSFKQMYGFTEEELVIIKREVKIDFNLKELFYAGLLLIDKNNRRLLKELLNEKNIIKLNTISEKGYEGVFYKQENGNIYSRDFEDWRFYKIGTKNNLISF